MGLPIQQLSPPRMSLAVSIDGSRSSPNVGPVQVTAVGTAVQTTLAGSASVMADGSAD
jgi:hypothetical protein